MDVEHIRGTYYAGQNATQEAFEELCAMVENINVSTYTLFRNKRFMLDEMFQRNASKFAIFLEYKNPCSFFVFHFMLLYLFFPLINALVYVDIDQGIH